MDLGTLPVKSDEVPLQYASLSTSLHVVLMRMRSYELRAELGYSSTAPQLTLEERKRLGVNVEQILRGEKEAAKAPSE